MGDPHLRDGKSAPYQTVEKIPPLPQWQTHHLSRHSRRIRVHGSRLDRSAQSEGCSFSGLISAIQPATYEKQTRRQSSHQVQIVILTKKSSASIHFFTRYINKKLLQIKNRQALARRFPIFNNVFRTAEIQFWGCCARR